MVILNLVQNLALLLALAVGYDYLSSRCDRTHLFYRLVTGVLFGAVAIVGMMTPVHLTPGVFYDARSIVLVAAAYMAGPVSGGIAGVLAASYRIWVGGAGLTAGLLTIAVAVVLGTAAYYLRRKHPILERSLGLWLFGLLLHVVMITVQAFLPERMFWEMFLSVGLPILVAYPLGVLLLLRVMLDRERGAEVRRSLEESEERYRSLFENSYAPMLLIDPEDGRIVDVNQVATDYYGWSKEDFRNMHVWDINTRSPDEIRPLMREARESGRNYFEFKHRRRDGSVRDVAVYSGSVTAGGKERLYSIIRDITQWKELEKELFLVGYSMEHAAIGVYQIAEYSGRILYANRHACETLGYTQEELREMTVFDLDPTFDHGRWSEHRRLTRENGSRTIETFHQRKDGSRFPVEVTVTMLDYNGEAYSFSFAKDISERKQMENELRRSLQQKELLLQEVHHRVRNNLAVMSGLVQLQLHALPPDDTSHPALSRTRDRIAVMGSIHNMLYHERNLSTVDFADVLERVVRELQERYAPDSGIRVEFDLEHVSLEITTALPLGLIVNEAVTNAFLHAFPGPGESRLTVSLRRSTPDACSLCVHDDGQGLGPAFRLERQESLGFRLMRLLADQIDASLDVRSDDGTVVEVRCRA